MKILRDMPKQQRLSTKPSQRFATSISDAIMQALTEQPDTLAGIVNRTGINKKAVQNFLFREARRSRICANKHKGGNVYVWKTT